MILGIQSRACLAEVSSKITAGSWRCLALEEHAVIRDADLPGQHTSGYRMLQANSFHRPPWQSRDAQRFSSQHTDRELSFYGATRNGPAACGLLAGGPPPGMVLVLPPAIHSHGDPRDLVFQLHPWCWNHSKPEGERTGL